MSDAATKLREEDLLAALGAGGGSAAPGSANVAPSDASAKPGDANGGAVATTSAGGALLSVDDFAAALTEIENLGPLTGKPQAPPRPGRSIATDTPAERSSPAAAPPQPTTEPEPEPEAAQPTATEPPPPETPKSNSEPISAAGIRPPAESPPVETATVPPAASSASETAAAAAAAAAAKGLKFKIGKKGAGGELSAPSAPATRMPDALAPGAAPSALALPALSPAVRLGKRVIRVVEAALDAVHRPLARISPNLLPVIGVCALTTIGVSALSIIALPILFPSRDAISYLDERIAALDAPKVEKPRPEAGGHGAEKPTKEAGGGHGDAKTRKKDEGDGHGEAKPKKKEGGSGHAAAAKSESKSATAKAAPAAKPGGAKKADAAKKSAAGH